MTTLLSLRLSAVMGVSALSMGSPFASEDYQVIGDMRSRHIDVAVRAI